jgi:hypothetical protein
MRVADEVAQRATATANLKTEQLRKAEFMLKVPRLHTEFIEKNGVDPFIDKFTKVVAEH